MRYQESICLAEDQFDEYGNLLPSYVLRLFQAAADRHADQLGLGFDAMLSRNFLWVVSQIHYEVCGAASPGQPVLVITWPLPPARVGFDREYLIVDAASASVLVKGTSRWVLIDTKDRRLALSARVYPSDEYCLDRNFEGRLRRLRDFEASGEAFRICPGEDTIDHNGHVNNTKYAEFALAALGSAGVGSRIHSFQIDFLHEVMCHQPLMLYHQRTDGQIWVKGLSEDGSRMFECLVEG